MLLLELIASNLRDSSIFESKVLKSKWTIRIVFKIKKFSVDCILTIIVYTIFV